MAKKQQAKKIEKIDKIVNEQVPSNDFRPLADILRPRFLSEVVGQDHILGEHGTLTKMVESGHIPSLIFWGPPGSGKTTIAKILAVKANCHFELVSAITTGVEGLRKIFSEAKERQVTGVRTLLMVDEIHRFNRAQQDLFLPYVEDGTVILVAATTENPSFEVNSALLSRCKTVTLKRLTEDSLLHLVQRAETYKNQKLPLDVSGLKTLANMSDGDGRYILNLCEELYAYINNHDLKDEYAKGRVITEAELTKLLARRSPLYDKHQDSHHNLISALHKSLRGSDVDAALYWFARMLEGGESPLYIVRRLVRFAAEDVGMADPNALLQACAAKEAYDFIGSPEGELVIAQLVVYLATAPKSNAVYSAYKSALISAKNSGSLMPPKHILNAPTKFMKNEAYGLGYIYDHDTKNGFSGQNYFPETMKRQQYYAPVERGFEREIIKRLKYWQKLRQVLKK